MPELVVGPMLRHVGPCSATVFVETDAPCRVEVLGHRAHTFEVGRHHYALVIVEGLQPGSAVPYDVHLDGEQCWPLADSPFPPSIIRTLRTLRTLRTTRTVTPSERDPVDEHGPDGEQRLRIMYGSCRAVAPHERPWTLELATDARGRGVDALWAQAQRMLAQAPEAWPDLVVMCGDQVYADDASPETRERIEQRRRGGEDLPDDLVRDFEEYCWLYHEAWRPELERWFFSVVPSVMIFDDHDMIDDWNISSAWVDDIRAESWWERHVVDGLMSYWIYQHLGNLSPQELLDQGILAELEAADDAGEVLRARARCWDRRTPATGGTRFSFVRHLGTTRLVVLDVRNARALDTGARSIIEASEWEWVQQQWRGEVDHLVVVSSLPVFVPVALHDLQVWNEAVVDGAWGRLCSRVGERLRRALDLEDWSAFGQSFSALVELLADRASDGADPAPATVTVLSGDIHFSYHAEVRWRDRRVDSRVHQLVCSPLRNSLPPIDRAAIRIAMTRWGRTIGRLLRRSVRPPVSSCSWQVIDGPVFGNCVGFLDIDGRNARSRIERAVDDEVLGPQLTIEVDRPLT